LKNPKATFINGIAKTATTLEKQVNQQCRDRGHKDAIKACDANNSFYDHLKRNPTHEINWDDVSYLDKDNNTGRRLIKEALYINAFDEGNLMNLKNPKPINPIWNEFRTFIRKNTKL